jgi:hypothetical protein
MCFSCATAVTIPGRRDACWWHGAASIAPPRWRTTVFSTSLWLADAVVAARLKWPRPLPLIAGALVHPSLRSGGHRPYPGDANWTQRQNLGAGLLRRDARGLGGRKGCGLGRGGELLHFGDRGAQPIVHLELQRFGDVENTVVPQRRGAIEPAPGHQHASAQLLGLVESLANRFDFLIGIGGP